MFKKSVNELHRSKRSKERFTMVVDCRNQDDEAKSKKIKSTNGPYMMEPWQMGGPIPQERLGYRVNAQQSEQGTREPGVKSGIEIFWKVEVWTRN